MSSEMVMSADISLIAPALLKAQMNMGNAVKDAKNPFYKSNFADLNAVREASTPALNENKIVVLQPIIQKEGKSFVRTLLIHESGQYIGSDAEIITAKQNDPQAYGSAISYMRRYSLQALVSLGAEDSDAEGAMDRPAYKKPVDKMTPIGTPSSTVKVTELALDEASELPKPKATFKKPTMSKPSQPASNGAAEGWE